MANSILMEAYLGKKNYWGRKSSETVSIAESVKMAAVLLVVHQVLSKVQLLVERCIRALKMPRGVL